MNRTVTRFWTSSIVVGACLLGGTACGGEPASTPTSESGVATQSVVDNPIDPGSVTQIADAVRGQNLELTGEKDVTAQVCPTAGCTGATAFDQATFLKFPTTGRATTYAGAQDSAYQVLDLVVTFPESTPPDVRTKYENAVRVTVR
ncbi:hypothetical protein [Gordonia hankookensis]|uniref:Lipoprotein n=1 Tax=Gordonia hankookensis TaxID=589403 RepID=A0ABR7W9C6_9ACTN|nr:hypothetical protein [Gordonia hankookensis]MBD1318868.1 hypothetical protein [Gordonia hankookensis]NDZ94388.1 hypothetical protein [Streptomyces sp. SID11726]NEB24962.1 hypothetical protein [Streptomyces sp. SID6673]